MIQKRFPLFVCVPAVVLVVLLSACAPGINLPTPSLTETPATAASPLPTISNVTVTAVQSPLPTASSVTPTPTPSSLSTTLKVSKLSPTQLKYQLIDKFGEIFFCDPDVYPVGRAISEDEFARRFAAIQQNTEAYQAILEHNHLSSTTTLLNDQKRLVYAEYKKLNAIVLEPQGSQYKFNLVTPNGIGQGFAIEGLIDASGTISVSNKQATITTCPICLAGDTQIATPSGAVPVRDLKKGMAVWTIDHSGQRQLAVIQETVRRPIALGTVLVHIVLDDGRELLVSAGHPTMDGRTIGDLAVGDVIDGSHIIRVEQVPSHESATFDILPSGETGAYWANGILLASTLSAK